MAETTVFKGRAARAEVRVRKRHPFLEDFASTFRAFMSNKIALVGFVIVLIYIGFTIADLTYPYYLGVHNINNINSFNPGGYAAAIPTPPFVLPPSHLKGAPSWWFWLGTTEFQDPILPIMLAALKVDIVYSFIIVGSGLVIGILLGSISGFLGGYVDEVLMRITDIFFSIPSLVLAIAFIYVLAQRGFSGLDSLVLALIVIWWPTYARLTRGVTLSVKNMKFIEASIASGATRLGIVFKHVIPNVLSPSLVQLSLDLGSIVLILAALDFINLPIISPFVPELGRMIYNGEQYLVSGIWWPVTIPGLFLLLFTVSVNLMGDGLRDVLDPKLRG